MSYEHYYNSTVSLKGILRSYYDQGDDELWKLIQPYASSAQNWSQASIHYTNPFRYDNDGYWIGDWGKPNLTFCFKEGYAKIFGFELATSNMLNLPVSFEFSSSTA